MALFVFVAEDVLDGGGLISRDRAVLDWFVGHRTQGLVGAARAVSTVGGFFGLLGLSLVTGALLWIRRWRNALVAAPLVSLLLCGAASTLAKVSFGRSRPPLRLHAVQVGLDAFPSSHAAEAAACLLATALTLSLTVAHRRWARLALLAGALSLAGLVGISRLVLAVHWFSDVVAGWALGTATAVTVVTGLWWVAARGTPRRTGEVAQSPCS